MSDVRQTECGYETVTTWTTDYMNLLKGKYKISISKEIQKWIQRTRYTFVYNCTTVRLGHMCLCGSFSNQKPLKAVQIKPLSFQWFSRST